MSGKSPWTASPEPVRSPTRSPIVPKAAAIDSDRAKMHEHAQWAGRDVRAGGEAGG